MKKILILILVSLILVGCNAIKNVPAITGAGTGAYVGHEGVVDIIQSNLDIFSPRELVQLKSANTVLINTKNQINILVDKKGSPSELVMDLPKLVPLYERSRIAYITAHGIIMKHIDEFSRQEQMILYSYESTCFRLDSAITEALMDKEGNSNAQTVKDILSFSLMIGKIVIPLLVL